MAKSNSPIRLDDGLMSEAKTAAKLHKRSPAEQIEYWASIGRSMAKIIDPEALIRVKSGASKIRIEATDAKPLDVDDVFASLDEQRESGVLSSLVRKSSFVYRAHGDSTGQLEQIDQAGNVKVGSFENGAFVEFVN